jgi:hypothetical protein
MQATNTTFGNANAPWLTIPKGEIALGRTTILVCADDYGEQSIVLDDVSFF